MNAPFVNECVHEADVQRALNLRIVYDEPIAALLFPIGVDR
jgi:hypothetical protein